jgi:hypothetical protein
MWLGLMAGEGECCVPFGWGFESPGEKDACGMGMIRFIVGHGCRPVRRDFTWTVQSSA